MVRSLNVTLYDLVKPFKSQSNYFEKISAFVQIYRNMINKLRAEWVLNMSILKRFINDLLTMMPRSNVALTYFTSRNAGLFVDSSCNVVDGTIAMVLDHGRWCLFAQPQRSVIND